MISGESQALILFSLSSLVVEDGRAPALAAFHGSKHVVVAWFRSTLWCLAINQLCSISPADSLHSPTKLSEKEIGLFWK